MIGRFGVRGDAAHDLFGEGPARGRQADERGRVHRVDHVGEAGWPARFGAGHGGRRLGETALRRVEVRAVRGEQAVDVDHADPGAGAPLGQAVGRHRPHDLLADPDARRPGAEHHHHLVAQPRPGGRCPRGQRGQDHGSSALDVVVEAEQLVAVALQDRQGVRGGEVLPLQQHTGQFGAHGLDEPVDEVVVAGAVDPAVPPAEVHAGRPGARRCRCRRPGAPAGCAPGRCRPAPCTATACRSGCPCRRCPGHPGPEPAARR